MSMFNGASDFSAFLQQLGGFNGDFFSPGGPQYEMVPQYARTFTGNTPLPSQPRAIPGSERTSPMELLFQALQRDTAAQQTAADSQFARNQEQIGFLEQLLPMLSGQIQAAGMDTMGQGQQMAGDLNALGANQQQDSLAAIAQALSGVQGAVQQGRDALGGVADDIRGQIGAGPEYSADVERMVGDAISKSDRAASSMRRAIGEYTDTSAQNASALASGIRRSAQSAIKQIESGMNPDGSLMTPAQQAAARQEVNFQVGQQVQQAATAQFQQYQQTKLAAEQAYSGLLNQAAAVRLQGAGTLQQQEALGIQQRAQDMQALGQLAAVEAQRAGLEMQGAEAQLQGEALAQQSRQARNQLAEAGASLRAATMQARDQAIIQAAQLETQGRFGLANLVQQNPETVISWFQGLLGFYSAQRGFTSFSGPGATGSGQGEGGTGGAFENPGGLFGGGGSMGRNPSSAGPRQGRSGPIGSSTTRGPF